MDPVLLSQSSKFLTSQLQQLSQSFSLWHDYNTTLAQLASEYFNARQQLTLFSSHEYYLPSIIFPNPISSQSKTSVLHTFEMNELYILQQTVTKLHHCINMLSNVIESLQFTRYEINTNYNNFINDQLFIVNGQPIDFVDIYNTKISQKQQKQQRKQLKGGKNTTTSTSTTTSTPPTTTPNTSTTSSSTTTTTTTTTPSTPILKKEKKVIVKTTVIVKKGNRQSIEPPQPQQQQPEQITNNENLQQQQHQQLDTNVNDEIPTTINNEGDFDDEDKINDISISNQDESIYSQFAIDLMNLPLITTDAYTNWSEATINKCVDPKLLEIDVDIHKSPQITTFHSISNEIIDNEYKLKIKESIQDDDNNIIVIPENEDELAYYKVNLQPKTNVVLNIILNNNNKYQNDDISSQINITRPEKYSSQYDPQEYYIISHIYTRILNQFDTILSQFLLEFEQKKTIIKCLIAINYDDIQTDLQSLTLSNRRGNTIFTLPIISNNKSNNNGNNSTNINENMINTNTTTISPLKYIPNISTSNQPLQSSSSATTSLTSSTSLLVTNCSEPMGINHIVNNMANNTLSQQDMKELIQMIELELYISQPNRQLFLQQCESIIRNHLTIE